MTERNHDSRVTPEARLSAPPLSPHLAAIWGAFLHEGVMLNRKRGTRLLEILSLIHISEPTRPY